MAISVRLKPELSKVLERECKRQRKTRSTLIQEALAAYLKPKQRNLGEVLAEALVGAPRGFGIKRKPPATVDRRAWTA
jgi:predicted transcriptional regulator